MCRNPARVFQHVDGPCLEAGGGYPWGQSDQNGSQTARLFPETTKPVPTPLAGYLPRQTITLSLTTSVYG